MDEERDLRFWSKVNKSVKGCWEWKSSIDTYGYGIFRYKGKSYIASRYSLFTTYGEIPLKKCVCHKCDNPSCVNPNHLFLGTILDNMFDAIKKGRRKCKLKIDDVRAMRKLYKTGNYKQTELANMFFVSKDVARHAIRYKTYRYIK